MCAGTSVPGSPKHRCNPFTEATPPQSAATIRARPTAAARANLRLRVLRQRHKHSCVLRSTQAAGDARQSPLPLVTVPGKEREELLGCCVVVEHSERRSKVGSWSR